MTNKALLLAMVVAVVCGTVQIGIFSEGYAFDFRAFWNAANSSTPYAPSAHPFGSPPTALLLLKPLVLVPMWPAYVVWCLFSLVAFYWAARMLWDGGAVLLALASPAVFMALAPGQLSLAVAALIFAAFASGPTARGGLIALALCIKPQMLFLAPLFFRRSELLSFGAVIAALALAATLAFGPHVWSDWIKGAANLTATAAERDYLRSAVALAPHLGTWAVAPALVAGATAVWLARGLPPTHRLATGVGASLLSAPYAMAYDLVALAPFAAMMILRQQSIAAAVTYSAALGPIGIFCLLPSLRLPSLLSIVPRRQVATSPKH